MQTALTPKEQEKKLAEDRGFTALPNNYSWYTYQRGVMRVWKTVTYGGGSKGIGWQTAALIDGNYQNHQPFAKLTDALDHAWMEAWAYGLD